MQKRDFNGKLMKLRAIEDSVEQLECWIENRCDELLDDDQENSPLWKNLDRALTAAERVRTALDALDEHLHRAKGVCK